MTQHKHPLIRKSREAGTHTCGQSGLSEQTLLRLQLIEDHIEGFSEAIDLLNAAIRLLNTLETSKRNHDALSASQAVLGVAYRSLTSDVENVLGLLKSIRT